MKAALKISLVSILLLVSIAFFPAKAQNNDDAALWTNIYLEKKIKKGMWIHLNQETRFRENMTKFTFAYADLGVTFKLSEHFNTSFDYVFIQKYYINKQLTDDYFSTRHQWYYNIVYKYDLWRWRFSLREQIQGQVKDVYSSEKGKNPDWVWRNKLTVKYYLTKKITPYVAGELYYPLNDKDGLFLDRTRTFAGVFYRMNKKNEFELYYMLQTQESKKGMLRDFVLGVGYAHEF